MKIKLFVLQLVSCSLIVFAVTDKSTEKTLPPKEGAELPYFPPELTEKHPGPPAIKNRTTDQEGYAGAGAKVPERTPSTGRFKVEGRPDKDIPVRDAE